MKVIWICHFTNNDIQDKLGIRKRIREFAPWISLGIKEAEKRDDIELHIVSPHQWIKGIKEFSNNNIHYHFFNPGIPYYGRRWPEFFRLDILSKFTINRLRVKKIVNSIKPDIIHLHGLENAYYSNTITQFINSIPVLATIQGFISLQLPKGSLSLNTKKRLLVEKQLLSLINNFGIRTKAMKEEIIKYNKQARFYWHEYFLNIPEKVIKESQNKKRYDLVYFARVAKEKGVEDLIEITGKMKTNYPDIRVAIIGGADNKYIDFLREMATKQKCSKNIDFFGFLPKQEDVYEVLQDSKICVLPTYNDTIPGTIIESMFRMVPVVSYNIGGIPDVNNNEEVLLLSDQGDINGMINNINRLLSNEELRNEYAQKASDYAHERWNNEKALDDIIKAYKDILNN